MATHSSTQIVSKLSDSSFERGYGICPLESRVGPSFGNVGRGPNDAAIILPSELAYSCGSGKEMGIVLGGTGSLAVRSHAR